MSQVTQASKRGPGQTAGKVGMEGCWANRSHLYLGDPELGRCESPDGAVVRDSLSHRCQNSLVDAQMG